MISVRNRQLRLSGNRLVGLCLCLSLMILASCDAFKATQQKDIKDKKEKELDVVDQSNKRYDPKTGTWIYDVRLNADLDTVDWKQTPKEEARPIGSKTVVTVPDETDGSVSDNIQLDRYRVTILMPFLTQYLNKYEQSYDNKSRLSLQFYSGAKLAFEQLAQEGVRMDVRVTDSKANETEVDLISERSEILDAHMVIGPVRSVNLRKIAAVAKREGIPLISPFSPSTRITEDNPYYLQVAPSLEQHCRAITQHIRKKYPSDQVVLVCRNKDAEIKRLEYFQNANHEFDGSTITPKLTEFIVADESSAYNELEIEPYIKEGKTTVFVVPSWSNESFVYSLMRKINLAKGSNKVILYGMPQWKSFDRIGFEYFERLNVHLSSDTYIDLDDPEVKAFRQRYYYAYGGLPEDEAYLGYDVVMYFAGLMQDYGTNIHEVIDQRPREMLHTKFEFAPVPKLDARPENGPSVERYENRHIHILEFKDFKFQLAG